MKKLLKSVFIVTLISLTTRVLAFGFRIYLSRAIGAEALGIYQIAMSIVVLIATATSGIPLTISRKTAEFRELNNISSERGMLTSALISGFAISGLLVTICYLLNDSLGVIFSDMRSLPLFFILLPSVISSIVYAVIRAWFWGQKKFLIFSITELTECIIRISLGVVFINGIVGGLSGALGAAYSFTISDIICAIIMLIIFIKMGGKLSRPNSLRPLFRSSTPITAVRLYTSFIQSLTAIILPLQLVASGVLLSDAIADFGRAMGMAVPLLFVPAAITGSIAVVLVPEAASDRAAGRNRALTQKIERSITMSILFAVLFIVVFIPLGKEIGILLYDDIAAGTYLSIAAIIMLPMNINHITSSMLNSLGLEGRTLIFYVIGSIALLASLWFLTPIIGTLSFALGLGICYTITSALNLRLLHKTVKLSSKYLFTIGFAILSGGLAIYSGIFLRNIISMLPNFAVITIAGGFSMLIFVIASYLMGYFEIVK